MCTIRDDQEASERADMVIEMGTYGTRIGYSWSRAHVAHQQSILSVFDVGLHFFQWQKLRDTAASFASQSSASRKSSVCANHDACCLRLFQTQLEHKVIACATQLADWVDHGEYLSENKGNEPTYD